MIKKNHKNPYKNPLLTQHENRGYLLQITLEYVIKSEFLKLSAYNNPHFRAVSLNPIKTGML